MNKRHRKLEKHRQLFLFRGIGDSTEYDTYGAFTVAARDPEHAIQVITQACTYSEDDSIAERLDDCLRSGLPIPKEWRPLLTQEFIDDSWGSPANWTFEKISHLPDVTTPQVLGASFRAG